MTKAYVMAVDSDGDGLRLFCYPTAEARADEALEWVKVWWVDHEMAMPIPTDWHEAYLRLCEECGFFDMIKMEEFDV